MRSDHNEDNSGDILKEWADDFATEYHLIDLKIDNSSAKFQNEEGVAAWPESRYLHLIKLREEAIQTARFMWSDFVWVNCASLLTDFYNSC